MLNFELYTPVRVVFGAGELVRVGKLCQEIGKKALIISYTEVGFYGDLFERIHASLRTQGIDAVNCFVATANPKLSEAQKGIAYGKQHQVDFVIGVGGGSAMDLAKVVAAGIVYPHELKKMIKFSHAVDDQIPPQNALPLVMVPTLPATASEMNPTAVITDDETNRKSYVWEPSCLYPVISILDPTLTQTLPAYQTACGGVDAISHALEPFLFSNEETFGNIDLQSNLQLGVIKTLYENLPKVLAEPTNVQLRGVMQFSATVALNGWLTTGVQGWTPMHQMGHVLSSHFGATHGATLACMILAWMRFFATHSNNQRFVKFAKEFYGTEDLLNAADQLEKYIQSLGVQTRIGAFGCTEADLERLTQGVVEVSFSSDGTLASIPAITREEAYEIYRLAL